MSRPDQFTAFDFDVVTGPLPHHDEPPREAGDPARDPAALPDAGTPPPAGADARA